MDRETILKLNVDGLKSALTELLLPITGLKTVLQNRLLTYFKIITDEDQNDSEADNFENALENVVNIRQESHQSHFTLRDIQDSLSYFNGTDRPNIDVWLQEFEDSSEAVGWNNTQKFIFAKQLLKGAAQLFISSQESINNWIKLKTALVEEFSADWSAADIHKILSRKKKQSGQSYLEFLYELMEIGKPIALDAKSIIEYDIEGIIDSRIGKAILYEAKTLQELKEKINIYEKIKGNFNEHKSKKFPYSNNLGNDHINVFSVLIYQII